MTPTYFGLLAEFKGKSNIPLEELATPYFGMKPAEAKKRAGLRRLPVPAFRTGGQKSPWFVAITDLAELIDNNRAKARREMQHRIPQM